MVKNKADIKKAAAPNWGTAAFSSVFLQNPMCVYFKSRPFPPMYNHLKS